MNAGGFSAAPARAVKRLIDATVALLLLPLAVPVLLVAGALVRWHSPGPALLRQLREGMGGRPFLLLKLRTMHVDADARLEELLQSSPETREEWRRFRRLAHDPRIVPRVGAPLRRWSIDELPQLWNVLRGDMSLVGPRPLELEVVQERSADTLAVRRRVRPGMSGLWQVSGRSEHDLDALCGIDARYVEEWSLAKDLAILGRTPRAVLSRRGAY